MRLFLLKLFLLLPLSLCAQRPSVDSLGRIAQKWAIQKQSIARDTNLILALNDFVFYKNYFKDKDTKIFLDSLERLTHRSPWKVGKGLLLWSKCNYAINFEQEKGPKAINLAIEALENLKKLNNPKALFYANVRMASIMLWNNQNNPKQKADGLEFAKNAVKYARAAKDTSLICHGLAYLANHLEGYRKLDEALSVLQEGQALVHKTSVSYFAENLIYGTMAGLFADMGNIPKTLEYIDKTLASGQRENDLYCQGSMNEFKAYMLGVSSKTDGAKNALPYYEKAYEYAQKLDDLSYYARVEEKLYGTYKLLGNWPKALAYLELFTQHQKQIDQKNIQKAYTDYDISSKELKIKYLENQQLIKDRSLKILENQNLLKDRDAKIKELNFLKLLKLNTDSLARQKEQKLRGDIQLSAKENKIKSLENDQLQKTNEKNNLVRNMLIASLLLGLGFILYSYRKNLQLQTKNTELLVKNKEIEQALLKGQTLERKRLAQELHDNLSAKISGVRMRLEAIKPAFETEKELKIYHSSISAMAEIYTDVRLISHNLLPADLETRGLAVATQHLVNELNTTGKTIFVFENNIKNKRFSSRVEYELFSIILELSNNIMKHAKAQNGWIQLNERPAQLIVSVADNGIGLNGAQPKKGMGFSNLQSRVEALNGTISYENDGGLRVKVVVPC